MNKTTLLFFISFLALSVQGQAPVQTSQAKAKQNALALYTNFIGRGSPLYNGSEYVTYRELKVNERELKEDEHPFLYLDWTDGAIDYEDQLHENEPLLYDLSLDEIILEDPDGNHIQLVKNKVRYFLLKQRKFVRLEDAQLPSGFYELLYDGQVKVYSKRIKERYMITSNNEVHYEFDEKTRYFVFQNGTYYPVKNKKSFLEIAPERAKALKKLIRENKLRFRSTLESSLVRLAKFYDQLQSTISKYNL